MQQALPFRFDRATIRKKRRFDPSNHHKQARFAKQLPIDSP